MNKSTYAAKEGLSMSKWVNKVKNLEAVCLTGRWYVRPANTLGSCGFYPVPWELVHVPRAMSADDAIRRAKR